MGSREPIRRLDDVGSAALVAAPLLCRLRRQQRAEHRALCENADVGEVGLQQRAKFRIRQLKHMVWVRIASGRRVDGAVWRADHEQPAGPQHSPHLSYKACVVSDVLKCFEGNDNIYRCVGQRQRKRITLQEAQVRDAVIGFGMCYHPRVYLDARDAACHTRQQRRAVALT